METPFRPGRPSHHRKCESFAFARMNLTTSALKPEPTVPLEFWRPEAAQWRTGEQVQVDLEDCLAAVGVAIHDDAVAIPGKAFAPCISGGGEHEPADDVPMRRLEVVERGDRRFRHEQDVHRRLWRDVAKGDDIVVLMDDVGRDFAADDPAEDGVVLHGASVHCGISLRLPKACDNVPRSTYSSSPPSGTPCARRLGCTPCCRASWPR